MAAGVAGGIVGGGTGAALGAIFPKLATAICAAAVAAIGAVGGSVADIAFAWDSFKNAENKDYAVGKIGFDGLIVYTDYKDIPDNWTAGAPPTDGGHYMGNLFDCSFGATSLLFTANIYSIVKYNYNE